MKKEIYSTTTTLPFQGKGVEMKKFHLNFIREGDFDIVWPNVSFFIIGHLLHFYSLYSLIAYHDDKTDRTWIFSESYF